MEHQPTLGEIMRRLDELSLEVKAIPLRFEESFIRRDVYRADLERVQDNLKSLTDRIHKEESRSEWIVRTVGALVIASVLALAFVIK
jgi:hypothetical protein